MTNNTLKQSTNAKGKDRQQQQVGRRWGRAVFLTGMALLSAVGLALFSLSSSPPAEAGEEVVVYKSPNCGCCGKWVDHLKANGFDVKVENQGDMNPIKRPFGIQPELQSCHTALIGGYVIEGHVPAEDIQKLLAERPDIKGLTAPGMPMGSPGMDSPRKDNYDVLAIKKDGSTQLYSHH